MTTEVLDYGVMKIVHDPPQGPGYLLVPYLYYFTGFLSENVVVKPLLLCIKIYDFVYSSDHVIL